MCSPPQLKSENELRKHRGRLAYLGLYYWDYQKETLDNFLIIRPTIFHSQKHSTDTKHAAYLEWDVF